MPRNVPFAQGPKPTKWKEGLSDLGHILAGFGGFGEAWVYIRKNLHVVKRHWVLFVLFVLLSAGAGYWIGRHTVSGHSQSTATHAPARAALPPDASDEQEWPPLTEAEIAAWAQELRKYSPPKEFGLHYDFPVNAKRFFRSFQTLGKQSGFKVSYSQGRSETQDITITCSPNNPFAEALAKQLRKYRSVRILTYEDRTDIVDVWLPEEN